MNIYCKELNLSLQKAVYFILILSKTCTAISFFCNIKLIVNSIKKINNDLNLKVIQLLFFLIFLSKLCF